MTTSADDTELFSRWGASPYGLPLAPPSSPSLPPPPGHHGPGAGAAGRYRRAGLALLALVIAGGAGGTTVALVDGARDSTTAGASSGAAAASGATAAAANGPAVVASKGRTIAGSPESAAAVISPSVVTIEVSGTQVITSDSPFGLQSQSQQVSDTGSGVMWRVVGLTGYIVTNNHVVAAAETGGTVHVTLTDGRTVAATIVGHDATSDLAVVKVSNVSGLTPAVVADSNTIKVGQAVLAVGAPLGLSNTVTQGIVSTLHRPVRTGESGASAQSVLDAVQTDAAINPGNSGGALVDLAGRVVGINSAIASTGSTGSSSQAGNIGVGFAIPSNDAADVAAQLIATGHATHAQIGLSAQAAPSSTDGAPGLGAMATQVAAGGPADKAGLQPGDIITKLGGRVVTDPDSLIVAVRAHKPGTSVPITYLRAGQSHTTTAILASAQ
jgi:putative serine protease PepD